ncbi:MAG: YbdD/YjiX family protein [Proteobacteria bacterium]|nr:YbdD/YjiX family protein [Pseudomonadota bacterium]
MRELARRLILTTRQLLQGAFGTDAYERYRAHHAAHHGGDVPLDRAAYFHERQRERWNGISRCC